MKNKKKRKPWQIKQKPLPDERRFCEVCHCKLGIKGGYANTGMCGPCATGEAETLQEKGETW